MSDFLNLWLRGVDAYRNGDEDSAIYIFSLIYESDARIAFNLSNIYIGQKKYSQAIGCLTKAFELNHSMAAVYFQRAYVRYQQGMFDSAYKNYLKTVMVFLNLLILQLLDGQPFLNCRSIGLDLTLYEKEIRMNMAVSIQAKDSLANNQLNDSLKLFVIPPGLFFLPFALNDQKNRNVQSLKIRTDLDPCRRLRTSPLSVEIEKETIYDYTAVTPVSLGKIRIKIFMDPQNAMIIVAERLISLKELSNQIRLKLKNSENPSLRSNESGMEIRSDLQLHEYLKDPECLQFKLKLGNC